MKRIRAILLLLLCCGFANTASSQVHLALSSNTVFYNDTVNYGGIVSYSVSITNTGVSPLNEAILINMSLTDPNNGGTITRSMGSFMDADSVLSPQESIQITFEDTVAPLQYVPGDNVVVIWPGVVQTPISFDTYSGTIYVSNSSEVVEERFAEAMFYPNPISSTAVLHFNDQRLSSVDCYSLSGQLLMSKQIIHARLPLSSLGVGAGVYLLKMYAENEVSTQLIHIY
jgi:hypothetical protein